MTDIVIPYEPRAQQLELHKLMSEHRFGVVVCHRRMGKALALDTPVPMADGGWSVMGLLKDGDRILGTDGNATTVVKAHDVMFGRDCYEVSFSNGETVVADGEHLWVTTRKKDRHNPVRTAKGRINMPRPAVARTTKEIHDTLRSRGEYNHRISIASPVKYSAKVLLLDPYVMGAWLGDGSSRAPAITSMDSHIIDTVTQRLPDGCEQNRVDAKNTGLAATYFWKGGFQSRLRQMGVLGNKHIPESYLTGSIEQRRELLCGLMDTDGHITKAGFCEITQKSLRIASDIEKLLFGLGMQPTFKVKRINGVPYYRIRFCPNFCCFTLPAKACRYKPSKRNDWAISITGVRKVASVPVRCITVDAQNSQFLVGEKLVPTHNTLFGVATLIHAALQETRDDARYGYIAPYYRQAKKVSWDYFKKFAFNIPGVKFYESELKIKFPNGSEIHLFGGDNPDALRGMYLDGCVIDEVADARPNLWGEVIRPALSDRIGWAVFIGTFKGVDKLYELYQMAQDSHGWFTKVFPASQTGIIPEHELEAARAEMSKSQYAREFECDPMAGSEDVLVPMVDALAASQRTMTDMQVKGAVRVLGVDVARYGNDRSVIFPVAGLKAYPPLMFENLNNVELANKVIWQIKTFAPDYVRIDAGRGEGVIDTIRSHGFKCQEVNFGGAAVNPRYANCRSEMLHGVRDWVERGGCIPDITELLNELATPYVGENDQGKLVVESKSQMKSRGFRSTDYLDALALAVGIRLRSPEAHRTFKMKNKSKGLSTSARFGKLKR